MLPVQLADERIITVEADSSLTATEVCRHIATDIGLSDQFGFAVYISIYDKVCSSLFDWLNLTGLFLFPSLSPLLSRLHFFCPLLSIFCP